MATTLLMLPPTPTTRAWAARIAGAVTARTTRRLDRGLGAGARTR